MPLLLTPWTFNRFHIKHDSSSSQGPSCQHHPVSVRSLLLYNTWPWYLCSTWPLVTFGSFPSLPLPSLPPFCSGLSDLVEFPVFCPSAFAHKPDLPVPNFTSFLHAQIPCPLCICRSCPTLNPSSHLPSLCPWLCLQAGTTTASWPLTTASSQSCGLCVLSPLPVPDTYCTQHHLSSHQVSLLRPFQEMPTLGTEEVGVLHPHGTTCVHKSLIRG